MSKDCLEEQTPKHPHSLPVKPTYEAEGLIFGGGQVRYKVRSLLSLICFHKFPPLVYD